MTVSYAALVAHVSVDGPAGPSTGARPGGVAVGAYAAVLLAAVVAAPLVTRARNRSLPRAATWAASLGLAVALATYGEAGTTVVLTAVHLLAVSVWLGGVVQLG